MKPVQLYCGVVRSSGLCFTSLALLGTREISLKGTTSRGVTFYGLSAEHAATRFIFSGNPVSCLSPWRDGTGWTESGDWARLTLSVLRHPYESLKAVSDLHERDRQCANTLGGSDTTHLAASSSQRLLRTTTEYLGEEMTRERSHRETTFIKHTQSLPREAETPSRTR